MGGSRSWVTHEGCEEVTPALTDDLLMTIRDRVIGPPTYDSRRPHMSSRHTFANCIDAGAWSAEFNEAMKNGLKVV